jgi:hypothetical protein
MEGHQVSTERAEFITGLRQIADWLEQHPEVETPYLASNATGTYMPTLPIYLIGDDQRAQLAAIARAMGSAEKTTRHDQFVVHRTFAGIALAAYADQTQVCERVVTATREITEEVPDPEALAAVPTVTRTRIEEDVEWRCTSLLAPAGAAEGQQS